MYRRNLFVLLFFVITCCVPVLVSHAWAEDNVLTLDKALSLAATDNPVLKAAAQRIEQARARFRQAAASQLPEIATSILYEETGEIPVYNVYTDTTWTTPDGVARAGFQQTWKAALTLTQVLYSSGAIEQGVASKKLALEAVRAEEIRTGQTVYNGVRQAYYGLQRTRAKQAVAVEALALAEEHLRQVKAMYRSGVVAKNEVLRVQVSVDDAGLNLIRAKNAVDVAWSTIERAVGAKLGDRKLPEPQADPGAFTVPERPEEEAFLNRPEIRALSFSERSARALSKAAVGERGPRILLQGESYALDETFFPELQDDWKISAVAEWQFYDGGKSRAKEAEARAAAEELLYRIEDMKREITLDVSKALLNLRSAVQRVNLASSQVTNAEEDYRMALRRYAAQVGTNIDVLDARVALQNARTQHVDAVYDALGARADLMFAMGTEPLLGPEKTQEE